MRSSAVVAVGTALSRLTGFVRIAAIAYALGVTALAGTYSYANETPNIVYELLLGGVLTATLVPLFVRHFESHDEDAAAAVFTVSILVLLAITVVGMLLAPWIVDLYTLRVHGPNRAQQQELATDLLRLFMPQMLFYGIATLATAMLNARRRFAAAAFAPIAQQRRRHRGVPRTPSRRQRLAVGPRRARRRRARSCSWGSARRRASW